MRIIKLSGGREMRFREIEKKILADGWRLKNSRGSHCYYIHPIKRGKVTIPNHSGDLDHRTIKSILKQTVIIDQPASHNQGGILYEINLSSLFLSM